MSAPSEKPAPQSIALRMMHGEHITTKHLRREFGLGDHTAAQLFERAQEIRTGYMLLKFARPRKEVVA
ncbi:MAG: hypothetical protein ACOC0Q_09065 [Wenzhouxiangella sp.]